MRRTVQLACVVALLCAVAPADAAQVLYATEDNGAGSKLYRVDPATASTQVVGTAGMGLNSIAIRPSDGAMFGMTSPNDSSHPNRFVTVDGVHL